LEPRPVQLIPIRLHFIADGIGSEIGISIEEARDESGSKALSGP